MEQLARGFAWLVRTALGLCALALVLAAFYVSLGRELVPLVAEYRLDAEDKAREALAMPVQIGALEGLWQGFSPVLTAHDVAVGEGAGALQLDQVRVVPDVLGSLLARQLRVARLEVDGLQLVVAQDAQGQWSLKGCRTATRRHRWIWPRRCVSYRWSSGCRCSTVRSLCKPMHSRRAR